MSISGISKTFNAGTINQKIALAGVDLQLDPGDFVTIIGGNGAGKSTLLNSVAGVYTVDGGHIAIGENAVTRTPEYKRAALIGRVFQDPMMGTAANMTIEENLSIALRRGKRRTLAPAIRSGERAQYREALRSLDLGLENRLKSRVGLLSGGQRQALTLLMASLNKPQLLLLDEHTAALDPKTAKNVLTLTQRIVQKYGLTAMMVTHNMKDALQYGNRTIMMHEGKVILDIDSRTKERLHVEDLLVMFERASGDALNNDRMLLS
ncbi:ABC transporter ATP-binding protein [Beduinella massiliensis]|uniref:ABC transporter ATP-binding protein n=1 Tax=Beduinella massiliensis TaxID=1852363 RepID=UPI0031F8BDB5